MSSHAVRARYVFPVDGEPIADGVLTFESGKILSVGQGDGSQSVCDLGNVAIVPGLINAHTHLEFSNLLHPIGPPGASLPDWIRTVVADRRQRNDSAGDEAAEDPILRGLRESIRCGTTFVGEIATTGWADRELTADQPGCLVFQELIGLGQQFIEPQLAVAQSHIAENKSWLPGISPHAPYSVHPQLLDRIVKLSAQRQIPLAMHLAESREELELLASQSGPFVDLLKELGAWNEQAIAGNSRPLDYLQALSKASRALVIHGNYLQSNEIDFVAQRSDRMAVVYCPRTHAFFGHDKYPLQQMLDAGVVLALGTDSRASNPDLSILEEMRFVAKNHPDVPLSTILSLATSSAARALGCESVRGSLHAGKRADFTVIRLPENLPNDPHEALFHSDLLVAETWLAGRKVLSG